MHFSFFIYANIYPLHVSNGVKIHHQETVTVYAAYGIYRASALTGCSDDQRCAGNVFE